MPTKSGAPLVRPDEEVGLVRPKVAACVASLEARGHSRMSAYGRLGGMLGKSTTWVRSVIGRQPEVSVRLSDALNIQAAYARLCETIETAAERIEDEAITLGGRDDAADLGVRAARPRHPKPPRAPPRRSDLSFRRAPALATA